MNSPVIESPPASAKTPPGIVSQADGARPRRKSFLGLLSDILDHGGPGYVQFAITNICNAQCDFCGFARDKLDARQRHSVTADEARRVVEICAANHIGYLLFVGGEPLAHPDLERMIACAADHGLHPMVCTNGSLWTEEKMRAFARAGLRSVIMSIDTHDVARHEEHRGLPEVCRKIRRANQVFAGLGVQTTASVTASRLVEDYHKLPEFLAGLGFTRVTFSYPLAHLDSSYLSFSASGLVSYRAEELSGVFEKIKELKRRSPFPVLNPTESLTEMQRHLRKEPERFGCLGGHKYFYLDWNLQLYRCHYWHKPMCHIYDFDESHLIRDGCTRCMIDCYRDPSVLQFAAISASDAWHDLKAGKLRACAGHLLDRRILTSLRAVWESRRWVGKV